jgi:hypothetical protein
MTSFDWINFLSQRGIAFVTKSPNLPRRDLVAIQCPWCGNADPSQHLAIGEPGYRCLRNPDHRGRNPARLVQVLTNCSWQQALAITGVTSTNIPSNFLERVQQALDPPEKPIPIPLELPDTFRPFRQLPSARPYISYLHRRGFTSPEKLTRDYDLHYCVSGAFKGRIIFPVYFNGELVSWTGRTISSRLTIRYKSLTIDSEQAHKAGVPIAVGPISNYLLWFDDLNTSNCNTIVLCEGPFDSLKVNVLGQRYGICSTCFFTSAPSGQQVNLLHKLLPRFKRRVLLLDRGTLHVAMRITAQLRDLNVQISRLSQGTKDPGELTSHKELLEAVAM